MAENKKNTKAKSSFFKGVKAEWGKIVWTDRDCRQERNP